MKTAAAAIFFALTRHACSFAPLRQPARSSLTELHNGVDEEQEVRKELEEKYLRVSVGSEYALADGANVKGAYVQEEDEPEPVAEPTRSGLQAKMDRITKTRAYPLFIAEKGFEILEDTIAKYLPKTSTVPAKKVKIVLLGTGWGAATFLKEVDNDLYDVTVISPRNYFLFTPMLAGASVGTVEYRSITEPVRELNRKANFLEAIATEIDQKTNTVYCQSVTCEGNSCEIDSFEVNYDRLIVSIGAQTNTFGIPGVREYCCFLKQVEDAQKIRRAIVNCFERANLPHLTDEERRDILTFAVIGAGPTGVEFASELRDFIEQDGPKYYPNLLKSVRINVIEASDKVLAPFDKALQQEALSQMKKTVTLSSPEDQKLIPPNFELTEVLLGCSVKEVTENAIILNDGRESKYGLAVWAAGNGPLPLTLQLIESMGEEQKKEQDVARGRLAVDPWLRVVGAEGKIMAFGDCTCITKNQLPATAQVAAQEAEYLASLMNKNYGLSPPRSEDGLFPPPTKDPSHTDSISEKIAGFAIQSAEYARPFQFLNLGILAYTGGGSALAQVEVIPEKDPVKGTGAVGNAIWRSVYLSKQVSWRNRLLVLNDWTKRQIFGRDITRL